MVVIKLSSTRDHLSLNQSRSHLSMYVSMYLSMYLALYLCIYLSVFLSLSLSPSIYQLSDFSSGNLYTLVSSNEPLSTCLAL